MEPKLILPTLVALGAGFFYLSGNQSLNLPNFGLGLGGVTDMNGNALGAVTATTPVLRADADPVALGTLVENIDTGTLQAAPAELRLVSPSPECTVTRPAPGQRVAAVLAEPHQLPSLIYSYDDDRFARAAAYELSRVFSQGHDDLAALKKLDVQGMIAEPLPVVNVIVPPGPAPVYLVLKDPWGDVLWNILPMPGARVENVTLLSARRGGVANLPQGATLQVPDIASRACGDFARVVEDPAVTEAAGFVPSDETRAQWDAYNIWFADTFDIPATGGLLGRTPTMGVLAGTLPPEGSPKAIWTGIEGTVVHMVPTDVLFAAEKAEHDAWFHAKAMAEIARAFGAPEGSDVLALVKPAIHERVN